MPILNVLTIPAKTPVHAIAFILSPYPEVEHRVQNAKHSPDKVVLSLQGPRVIVEHATDLFEAAFEIADVKIEVERLS